MQITVNGASFDAPEACTVADLLSVMALEGQRCAVELNGDIVSRSDWPHRAIAAGDRVERRRALLLSDRAEAGVCRRALARG